MSKLNKHWEALFQKYDILNQIGINGFFDITAKQIKEFHEPRLMCKMDFREQVAKPFAENNLSILAIENGLYRIAKTDAFLDIDLHSLNNKEIQEFQLPDHIETLGLDNIKGESQALDAAMASGMINALIGEDNFLTIRGRRRSSEFEIILSYGNYQSTSYPISGVQIEVDGGYESKNCLALIEAKMRIGISDNMNVRQLLYPHIHFENTTKKTVKTYVMFYEKGGLYTFIPMIYVNQKASLDYANTTKFRLIEIQKPNNTNVLPTNLPAPNNNFPFPQADYFDRVIYTLLKIYELQPISKYELFSNIPVVPRQYDYYFNTLRWFNLAAQTSRSQPVTLTELGEIFVLANEKERLNGFAKMFYMDFLVKFIINNEKTTPTLEVLQKYKMNETTFNRRRSTVIQWHKYFSQNSSLG